MSKKTTLEKRMDNFIDNLLGEVSDLGHPDTIAKGYHNDIYATWSFAGYKMTITMNQTDLLHIDWSNGKHKFLSDSGTEESIIELINHLNERSETKMRVIYGALKWGLE